MVNTPSSQAGEPQVAPIMHNTYGMLVRFLFRQLFGEASFPSRTTEQLHELSQHGTVVHVARGRSSWLALYFNYVFIAAGVPLAQFVGGVSVLVWQPIGRFFKLLRQRFDPILTTFRAETTDEAMAAAYSDDSESPPTRIDEMPVSREESLLARMLSRGNTAFVVIPAPHQPSIWLRRARHDYIRAVVAAQRASSRPIYVMPYALTDRLQSGVAGGSLADKLLGHRRRLGTLRQLPTLFSTLRHATICSGDPIDVQKLIQSHPDLDDRRLARKIRHLINRSIDAEERAIAGPELLPFELTVRHILRDPSLRTAITEETTRTGKSEIAVLQRTVGLLRGIAARYDVRYIRAIGRVMQWIFNRIYDGLALDESGLAKVLDASRRGPIVYCPSHRSHIDYLVLSYVLWERGITPPHIAAGANLAFFPLGIIFRGCGAFFLRRSFRDDPLYAAVFRAYVSELLKTGTSIEFFPEGTRSRTGKLLMPKFGMLSMIIDAWRQGIRQDISFVPVSIDYERIIEAGSYHKELAGGQKQKENIGGLLKTTKVLRSRYGRVYVQFGEPLSLSDFAAAQGIDPSKQIENEENWRRATERIGYQIMHRIAMACSVTPTSVVATALLSHRMRAISASALLQLCEAIVRYLVVVNARLTPPLRSQVTLTEALLDAVQKLVDDGLVVIERAGSRDSEAIYRVPEDGRILLDFHKNAVMNYFVPGAIVARAMMARGGKITVRSVLHERTRFLSRLFKREFIYPLDGDFDSKFDSVLKSLQEQGFIEVHGDTIEVKYDLAVTLLSGLLDSYVQGYWITAITLRELQAFPLWQRELVSRTIEGARRAFLEGKITRPESANRTLVENALVWLEQHGVTQSETVGKKQNVHLSRSYSISQLDALIANIASYL